MRLKHIVPIFFALTTTLFILFLNCSNTSDNFDCAYDCVDGAVYNKLNVRN